MRESATNLNLLFEGRVFRVFRIVLAPKQDKTSQTHTLPYSDTLINIFIFVYLELAFFEGVKFSTELKYTEGSSPNLVMVPEEGFIVFETQRKAIFLKEFLNPTIP